MVMEKTVQENLIQNFKHLGFQYLGTRIKLQGHSPRLDENFKTQMERLNKEALKSQRLSDSEFQRLRNKYPKNHKEAFGVLRHGISIILDDNREVHLNFIDKNNIDNNVFQITDEFEIIGIKTKRLDVLVLINGVPLVNIEMKRPGLKGGEQNAIEQINSYSREGVYKEDLLNFLQLFVVSNDVTTRYFSVDPRVEKGQARYGEFAFTWMDEKNKPVNKMMDFVKEFFNKEHFIKVLYHYMLMKPIANNEQIVIMRPYQIHAVNAVMDKIGKGFGHNTYVSASTGSGKTLTSFKLSELLAFQGRKVIMLLDRNDLAEQTTREFKQFDATGLIKDLVKREQLRQAMSDDSQRLVITTMQSFNKYVNNPANKATIQKLSEKKEVAVVVDECHRSTGDIQFANIKRAFFDRELKVPTAHFIGFTGTPLYAENASFERQQTQEVFGEVSHVYTITEAIRDKSVTPFRLFHIASEITNDYVKSDKTAGEYFGNPARIKANAEEIAKQFKSHTLQSDAIKTDETKGFMAMVAVGGKFSAHQYWQHLYSLLKEQNRTVAMVFSIDEQRTWGDDRTEQQIYGEVLQAYDEDFGTNFYNLFCRDGEKGRAGHLSDVVERSRAGEIDMIVVSDMLLTGYDNKLVNTLYLDKNLKDHGLLQAVSRTNRTVAGKSYGNIVFFTDRAMEEDFKESIKLFGNAENVRDVIKTASFDDMTKELVKDYSTLRMMIPTPDEVMKIGTKGEWEEIAQEYGYVCSLLHEIKAFPEWADENDEGHKTYGIDTDYLDYVFANLMLMKEILFVKDPKDSSTDDNTVPTFNLTTIEGDIVGHDYIVNLLRQAISAPSPEKAQEYLSRADKAIKTSTDLDVKQNRKALEKVVKMAGEGILQDDNDMYELLEQEKKKEKAREYLDFSEKYNLPYEEIVQELIDYYNSNENHMSKASLARMILELGVLSAPHEARNLAKAALEGFKTIHVVS